MDIHCLQRKQRRHNPVVMTIAFRNVGLFRVSRDVVYTGWVKKPLCPYLLKY